MYTIDQINAMSPEERKAVETEMSKAIVKRMFIHTAVKITVAVAIQRAVKHYADKA